MTLILGAFVLVALLRTDQDPTLFVCTQLIGAVLVWLTVFFNWESFVEKARSVCNTQIWTFVELMLPIFAFSICILAYLSGIKAVVHLGYKEDGCGWDGSSRQDAGDDDDDACQSRQTVALLWATQTLVFVMVLLWRLVFQTLAPMPAQGSPRRTATTTTTTATPSAAARARMSDADWANALHSSVGNIYGARGPAAQATERPGEQMRFVFVDRGLDQGNPRDTRGALVNSLPMLDDRFPQLQTETRYARNLDQAIAYQRALQWAGAARRSRHR